MKRKVELERFHEVLGVVARNFPALRVDVADPPPEDIDAFADLPAQAGLDFAVQISLQNADELHLGASNFGVEWFPCGDQQVFERYVEALLGLLSGRFRILERFVASHSVSARLQKPTSSGGWETLATWSNLLALLPWPRSKVVVQNRPSA